MATEFTAAVSGSSAVDAEGSNGATGVLGRSDSGNGVYGTSDTSSAAIFEITNVNNTSPALIVRTASNGTGTGSINSSAGIFEFTNPDNTVPVLIARTSGNSTGIDCTSNGGIGIAGHSQSNTGIAGNSQTGTGVSGSGNIGLEGFSTSTTGTGILGHPPSGGGGFAGKFLGNVDVQGTLAKSAGTFKIDHPLAPAQKYLSHAFVESAEMKNIYDGIVVLDDVGEAVVELPSWFEALNTEFRYQLTCIGGYAPVYIAQEVEGNRFKIAGGKTGMKVSWQVTGNRHDPYALAHPLMVEEEKPEEERGYYRHPELYHEPEEKGTAWANYPEQMQRLMQVRRSEINAQ